MARGPGKGNTNNPNGRPKGVPNKTTFEIREKLKTILESETKSIQATLKEIKKDNPVQYLTLLEKFLAYVIPKKRDITSDDKPIQVAPITGIRIIEDGVNKQSSEETD